MIQIRMKIIGRVWYLDAKKFDLNYGNRFFFLIRNEFKNDGTLKGYDLVLKNRDDNRHNALKYHLSNPKNLDFDYKEEPEFKFEEDIMTTIP